MWQNVKSFAMQYKHTRLLHALEILYSAFFLLDALLPKNTEIFYRGCGMSDLHNTRRINYFMYFYKVIYMKFTYFFIKH
jgi:hypothetical protein